MKAAGVREKPRCRLGRPSEITTATSGECAPELPPIDWTFEATPEPLHPLIRRASLEPREDDDDYDLHPNYDLTAQLDAMLATPYNPDNKLLLRWRDLGDELVDRGDEDLAAALEAALAVLNARIAADVERRRGAAAASARSRRKPRSGR